MTILSDAGRDPAMRRRTVLERAVHAAEPLLQHVFRMTRNGESLAHHVGRWFRIAPEESSIPLQTMSY